MFSSNLPAGTTQGDIDRHFGGEPCPYCCDPMDRNEDGTYTCPTCEEAENSCAGCGEELDMCTCGDEPYDDLVGGDCPE